MKRIALVLPIAALVAASGRAEQPQPLDSALEQAFRYADRLPPVERNLIKGF